MSNCTVHKSELGKISKHLYHRNIFRKISYVKPDFALVKLIWNYFNTEVLLYVLLTAKNPQLAIPRFFTHQNYNMIFS